MKIIAKPIEMLAISDPTGDLNPIKFRMKVDDNSLTTIKIDRIKKKETTKRAG